MKNKNYLYLSVFILTIEILIALFLKTGFIRHTFGDYLAAIFVYCVLAFLFRFKITKLIIVSLFVCYSIEFLQLFKILHLLNLQQYKMANLVFGNHFSISDLVAYTLGIVSIANFNNILPYENK